ncbi:MAG TPA: acyltransferase [Longimicrobium sp.]|nr:acyltransferase [Longimicrobium sp.]
MRGPRDTTALRAGEAHARFLGTKFFSTLDGLRALAIVFVVGHHAMGTEHWLFGYEVHFALFFGISGFLITTLLLRERSRYGGISLKRFYIRRALRIYPLYYAVLALYCLLVFLTERGTAAGAAFWDNLPAFATFTTNWFVPFERGDRVIFYFAWSLAAQEQFYLVWPWIVSARRRWVPVAFLAALLAADAAVAAALSAGWLEMGATGARIATSASAPILLGALLAYAAHHRATFAAAYGVLGRAYSLPVAFGVMAALYAVQAPEPWMTLAIVAVVGAGCIRPDPAMRWAFANRPLAWVGTISYGLYLMHMLSLNVARRLELPAWPEYLLGLAIAIAAAAVSYRWFESPLLELKDRFAGRRPASGWGEDARHSQLPTPASALAPAASAAAPNAG